MKRTDASDMVRWHWLAGLIAYFVIAAFSKKETAVAFATAYLIDSSLPASTG